MRPEDLHWIPPAAPRDARLAPVEVQWLGTAGFALRSGDTTILVDPYVTRASFARCATGAIASAYHQWRSYVPRADAIVVGHTHFDHVLDVPAIASAHGAHVYGSRSAARLCLAQGVPAALVHDVEADTSAGRTVTTAIGPFEISFVPSAHSPLLLGRVPFPGELSDCDALPMRVQRYRCGAVFSARIAVAGRVIYHLGSAELLDQQLRPESVDLLLFCVAGWTTSTRLPYRVSRALAPRTVLLSHWDDFFRPLSEPARMLPAMRMPALVDSLVRESRDTSVVTLPLMGRLWL